jgi:uncharacterized protein YegL
MTDKDKTLLVALIDRSGSMEGIRLDMEGGFNTLMKKQAKLPGECFVSLYQFDDKYECVFENTPIAHVPPLRIEPRGSTALLDALHRTIVRVGRSLSLLAETERPGAVVFIVITDGRENASHEVTRAEVRASIAHQQSAYQWQFVYLGADPHAFAEAADIGIAAAARFNTSTKGVRGAYKGTHQVLDSYRGAVRGGITGQSIGTPDASDVDDDPPTPDAA